MGTHLLHPRPESRLIPADRRTGSSRARAPVHAEARRAEADARSIRQPKGTKGMLQDRIFGLAENLAVGRWRMWTARRLDSNGSQEQLHPRRIDVSFTGAPDEACSERDRIRALFK